MLVVNFQRRTETAQWLSCGHEGAVKRASDQAVLLSLERDVADLDALLKRIREGDPAARVELLNTCAGGIRFFLQRTFQPSDPDAAAACVSEALIRRIRAATGAGSLAELVRLAAADCGFHSPARPVASPDKVRTLRQTLRQCSPQEREFLERCYLHGEDPVLVSEDLGMTCEDVAALRRKVGRPGNSASRRAASAGR
jgi:hypothetical protein